MNNYYKHRTFHAIIVTMTMMMILLTTTQSSTNRLCHSSSSLSILVSAFSTKVTTAFSTKVTTALDSMHEQQRGVGAAFLPLAGGRLRNQQGPHYSATRIIARPASSSSTSSFMTRSLASSSSSTITATTTTRLSSAASTILSFDPTTDIRDRATSTLLIGRHSTLKSLLEKTDAYVSLFGFRPHPEILTSMHDSLSGGSNGAISSHVIVPTVGPAAPRPPHRMSLLGLKNKVSRHNHPLSLHALTDMVRSNCSNSNSSSSSNKKGTNVVVHVLMCVEDDYPIAPVAMAIARAFPLFSKKTKSGSSRMKTSKIINVQDDIREDDDDNKSSSAAAAAAEEDEEEGNVEVGREDDDNDDGNNDRVIHVTFLDSNYKVIKDTQQIDAAKAAADGVRLACRLVDTPPEELTTTAYSHEVAKLFEKEDSVTMEEIVGEDLNERGYGGIYNVGKGATEPPRLIILTYEPPTTTEAAIPSEETNTNDNSGSSGTGSNTNTSITLIGKGIVYDTGGLAIKTRAGMCGMKHDMAGSAGVLGGFWAAVQLRTPRKIRLLLCLAENAIGPKSVRNDDIITLYSGKTVEINNSDAEGRLVLSDAVAHATRHYSKDCNLVVDMATLTGAQLVSTGKVHAAILANTEELEQKAVKAGLKSGDLCYPLLYAPDLLKEEFNSKVADMKNSVKDRSNAQCSCAGHFIESHIDPNYEGGWLHVDMAGPGSKADRGTGYGVGLVLSLVGVPGFDVRK